MTAHGMTDAEIFLTLLAAYGLTWMVAAMHDARRPRRHLAVVPERPTLRLVETPRGQCILRIIAENEGRRVDEEWVDEEWARLCEAVDVTWGGEGA